MESFITIIKRLYNSYYYKEVKCCVCDIKFLRDKRYDNHDKYVCSTQCFLIIPKTPLHIL